MGISFREFEVAMEALEAERLENCTGSRYNVLVPCFKVEETIFYHSSSYYIVHKGKKISDEIMNSAMAAVGEKFPGGDNFWWGEVHSIKGMITLVLMLKDTYTKELASKLINNAYKKLLESSLIKENHKVLFDTVKSHKMQVLRDLLVEYNNIVNPFGNPELKLAEPSNYLDEVQVNLAAKEEAKNTYARLSLTTSKVQMNYDDDDEGWTYKSDIYVQRNRRKEKVYLYHYFDIKDKDEVIYLDYDAYRDKNHKYEENPDDIDLRISLKTGLAWKTYKEKVAKPVTEEQLDVIIKYLKITIKKLRKTVISKMVVKE